MSQTFERIIHVRVSGRVQRVGYRAWTEGQADARGLMGWVRNRHDGSVEAVFAGKADAIAGMAQACWRGPTSSEVAGVEVQEVGEDALGTASKAAFLTLPTA